MWRLDTQLHLQLPQPVFNIWSISQQFTMKSLHFSALFRKRYVLVETECVFVFLWFFKAFYLHILYRLFYISSFLCCYLIYLPFWRINSFKHIRKIFMVKLLLLSITTIFLWSFNWSFFFSCDISEVLWTAWTLGTPAPVAPLLFMFLGLWGLTTMCDPHLDFDLHKQLYV